MAVYLDLLDKKMSYLRARDRSLVSHSAIGLFNRKNLHSILDEHEDEEKDPEPEESGYLDVYLRIKKIPEPDDGTYVIDANNGNNANSGSVLRCNVPVDSQSGRNVKTGEQMTKLYTFSHIFPPQATQIEVFDHVVKRKVLNFINGENSNLLTYGTSGAGKTFTIVGTDEHPGMIPQTLEYLFRSLPDVAQLPVARPKSGEHAVTWLNESQMLAEVNHLATLFERSALKTESEHHLRTYMAMQKRLSQEPVALLDACDCAVSIWISFAEIYNDHVYDLLVVPATAKQRKRLTVYNNKGETYIKGLSQVHVADSTDAYLVLQFGLHNLNYAATSLNAHSSRSHCIFTITMVQTSMDESKKFHVSRINFSDLAGSERTKKTNNVGSRLNESNNINNSLMVLGRCISIIRKVQRGNAKVMVPFRESKLTLLFHKALIGQEDISMIVNITPDRGMFDETMHALNFSALAQDIALEKSSAALKNISDVRNASNALSSQQFEETISRLQWQLDNANDELMDLRIIKEERELEIRQELVQEFRAMLAEEKRDAEAEMEEALAAKDEMIDELADEVARLRNVSNQSNIGNHTNSKDVSVINLDSDDDDDDDDEDENVADLSYATRHSNGLLLRRYEHLYDQHNNLKLTHIATENRLTELNKMYNANVQLLKKVEFRNKVLEDELEAQKLEIIKLRDDNDMLDEQVEHSLRYTQAVIREFEDHEDDCQSTESSDADIIS